MIKFRDTIKLIRDQQQTDAVWHYNFFSRYVCLIVTSILVFGKCKPNIVTFSMFIFGVVGGIFISIGNDHGFLYGTLFFIVLNIADTSDGELARITSQTTKFGEYLDRLCHYFTNTIFCFALGIGLAKSTLFEHYLTLGMLAGAAYALDDASKDLLVLVNDNKNQSRSAAAQTVALSGASRLSRVISDLFSHSSFWHICPVLVLLSWAFPNVQLNGYRLFEVYAVTFLILVLLKPLYRIPKIAKFYGK